MSDIFLSYKKEEKAIAKIYAGALELNGFSVWWDPDIDHGDIFDEVIQEQLDAAKCVMVLWSSKSVKSKWVRAEATAGEDRLVPVLIEEGKIPVPFNLIQAANLIGWRGDQTDPEFLKLLGSVSKKVGRPIATKTYEKEDIKVETEALKKETADKKKIESTVQREHVTKKEEKESITPFKNTIDMEFVLIPSGEFDMGSPSNEVGRYDDEGPVHRVKIPKSFYMGKYEVTQKQWRDIMGNDPSRFKGDNLPVEQVSWNDVQKFIKKLNKKENTKKYRLPSEAEWEYAARAENSTRYFFGDDDSKLGEYAWYHGNSEGRTHPVGQKKPNSWGLYDIHGNVWEWVQDKYQSIYDGAPTDGSSWESEIGMQRVLRGGAWSDYTRDCRLAYRGHDVPGDCDSFLGFRLVRIL